MINPTRISYDGRYYLSWGAFYAMSDNLYGPYDYKRTVMNEQSFAPGYAAPTWPHGPLQGRHGSFFKWNTHWYFAYCDMSQSGSYVLPACELENLDDRESLCLVFRGSENGLGEFDAFTII